MPGENGVSPFVVAAHVANELVGQTITAIKLDISIDISQTFLVYSASETAVCRINVLLHEKIAHAEMNGEHYNFSFDEDYIISEK